MKSYYEKLKDPRWQKIRLKVLERDEFICQICGDALNTLNVHHKFYKKNCEPWDYELDDLITYCEDCHERETKDMKIAEQKLLLVLKQKGFKAYEIEDIADSFKGIETKEESFMTTGNISILFESKYISNYEECLKLGEENRMKK